MDDCKLDVPMVPGSTCKVKCDESKGYSAKAGTYVCPDQGSTATTSLRCTIITTTTSITTTIGVTTTARTTATTTTTNTPATTTTTTTTTAATTTITPTTTLTTTTAATTVTGEYVIQNPKQACSSQTIVTTLEECKKAKKALEPNAPSDDVQKENFEGVPGGCSRWNGVWFFNDVKGKLDGVSYPVCKVLTSITTATTTTTVTTTTTPTITTTATTTTAASLSGEYVIQNPKQACSSQTIVTTLEECKKAKKALEPNAPSNDVQEENFEKAPGGCSRWNGVWFFNDVKGTLDGLSHPVCKVLTSSTTATTTTTASTTQTTTTLATTISTVTTTTASKTTKHITTVSTTPPSTVTTTTTGVRITTPATTASSNATTPSSTPLQPSLRTTLSHSASKTANITITESNLFEVSTEEIVIASIAGGVVLFVMIIIIAIVIVRKKNEDQKKLDQDRYSSDSSSVIGKKHGDRYSVPHSGNDHESSFAN